MKERDILLISLLLGAVVLIAFLLRKSSVATVKESTILDLGGAAGPPPADTSPQPDPSQPIVLYDTETGEGGAAVQQRIKTIWQNAAARNDLVNSSGLLNRVYQGLQYPAGIKNAMAGVFGSSSAIPIIPDSLDTSYSQRLQEWKDVTDFEAITSTSGIDQAFSTWKNAFNLVSQGLDFWPPTISVLIEAKEFGDINRGDRNRSERYQAFTNDMRKVGENLALANSKMGEIVRDRAIADLRAAGWNFIGYDAVGQGTGPG